MKSTLTLLACATCLITSMPAAEETPLGKQMEQFNDAYKAFRKETDPAKGAALAREAQQAVIKAIAEVPERVTKMPDGPDKAIASAEYRKMLGQVFVSLCDVEKAFLAGKPDEVRKIIASLKDMKKAGHDKFMEDE